MYSLSNLPSSEDTDDIIFDLFTKLPVSDLNKDLLKKDHKNINRYQRIGESTAIRDDERVQQVFFATVQERQQSGAS